MDQRSSASGAEGDVERVYILLFGLSALGILSLILTALFRTTWTEAVTTLASGLFLAGAATLSGAVVGFLFGVPRRRSSGRGQDGTTRSDEVSYKPNTNLEQISDWLSKIIVGISLTQISNILGFFRRIGVYCGPAFGRNRAGEIIATSIVIHYLLVGFFFGFLMAYLWLPGAFSRANRI